MNRLELKLTSHTILIFFLLTTLCMDTVAIRYTKNLFRTKTTATLPPSKNMSTNETKSDTTSSMFRSPELYLVGFEGVSNATSSPESRQDHLQRIIDVLDDVMKIVNEDDGVSLSYGQDDPTTDSALDVTDPIRRQ